MNIVREPSATVREVEHCWIPMPDGTRLSARLWLPTSSDDAPVPAILEYIPYRKRDMVRLRDERNHSVFARHGYACVRVDMRGSGDSEGVMSDMYEPAELDDALSVIAWIADQPWCDGSIGMMGTSWGGTSALQAASRRPDALKAVIAVCATSDRFDNDIHHMGGCLLTDTVEWGATLAAILASPPDAETVGPKWRKMWRTRLEALAFPLENWVRHETRDDYWRFGAVNETPGAIQCPVLAVGGWVDRYSNSVMSLMAQGHAAVWGIVGPWGHHYPDQGCPGPGIGFQQEALRWWDHWLKGNDTGVDREPKLRVWMQSYAPPRDFLPTGPGQWISEREWIPSTMEPLTLHLGNGTLSRTKPASSVHSVDVPNGVVGLRSGDTGYFGRHGGLPGDQADEDEHALIFETKPLDAPIELLGSVKLVVSVSMDQPVATLAVRLCDVPTSDPVGRVCYTVRNLALDDQGQPWMDEKPGQSRELSIALPNTAYRFEAGHRIRLSLSSSYWPQICCAPKPARVRLDTSGASLILPCRMTDGGTAQPGFEDPAILWTVSSHEVLASPKLERHVDVDLENGQYRIGWHQPFTETLFHDIDLRFGYETQAHHVLTDGDTESGESSFRHRLRFRRNDKIIDVTGTATLTATEKEYRLQGTVIVVEDEEVTFERSWSPTIRRRHS